VVSDSGPGIEPGNLSHVFERFWQVHQDPRHGLGLGLYICAKIVGAHAGHIWAESAPGKGATFRFTLPSDEGTDPLLATPPSDHHADWSVGHGDLPGNA
jgi:signal transduction histidine kinase